MVTLYSAVLGGLPDASASQVASEVPPGFAGSFTKENLTLIGFESVAVAVSAELVASTTVPVHVPVPLAVTSTGPGEPKVVSGMARTAATGSLEWSDWTQSFFNDGLSLADPVMLQFRLLPDPAVMVGVPAPETPAVKTTSPPVATAAAAAPTIIRLITLLLPWFQVAHFEQPALPNRLAATKHEHGNRLLGPCPPGSARQPYETNLD